MFKGVYNGKQCHLPDIAAVLTRAWNAGVDRIIVSLSFHPSSKIKFLSNRIVLELSCLNEVTFFFF